MCAHNTSEATLPMSNSSICGKQVETLRYLFISVSLALSLEHCVFSLFYIYIIFIYYFYIYIYIILLNLMCRNILS